MRFLVKIFMREPYSYQLFPGKFRGTYFIACISKGSIFLKLILKMYGSPRFPWKSLFEIRFPVKIFLREVIPLEVISKLFPGKPKGIILFGNYLLEKRVSVEIRATKYVLPGSLGYNC
jgi:hypothetical protein